MMDQHYPKRRGASLAVVVPILVIGCSGVRPADYDELMLKWVSAALALSLIAAFLGASGFPIDRMHPMAGWRMHPNGDRWGAPIAPGVNPVLPMEKPDNGERLSLEVVARAVCTENHIRVYQVTECQSAPGLTLDRRSRLTPLQRN
jgi:hypothetical protein